MSTMPESIAFVRCYVCQYSKDKKKAKAWHDGSLALHHLNRKAILMDERDKVLSETFLPAVQGFMDRYIFVKSYRLPKKTIQIEEYLVQVDDVLSERFSDLSELQKTRQEKRSHAKEWLDNPTEDEAPRKKQRIYIPVTNQKAAAPPGRWQPRAPAKTSSRCTATNDLSYLDVDFDPVYDRECKFEPDTAPARAIPTKLPTFRPPKPVHRPQSHLGPLMEPSSTSAPVPVVPQKQSFVPRAPKTHRKPPNIVYKSNAGQLKIDWASV